VSQTVDENPFAPGGPGGSRPADRTETIPERRRSGSGRSGSGTRAPPLDASGAQTDRAPNDLPLPDGDGAIWLPAPRTVRLSKRGNWESRVLHGHSASVDAIDFSLDGSLLASMGRDGTVRLWKPELALDPSASAIQARFESITSAVIGSDDPPRTAQ
jgi:hypothetical protein